ncbi:MAG: T9SS type A sorting domain-containing protein [Ferruginibacter sp.]|nr:T9SS type A sorting domain-containing protein [Ferruginibacter sp.]
MKKGYLFLAGILLATIANATNYYVDGVNGSDAVYTGLSPVDPFRSISKAANLTNPGDTVFIMNGTYTSNGTVLTVNRSGSDIARIVYTNFPGHLPKLQASATSFAVISFSAGTSYITINGLEISGNGVNLTLAADSTPAKNQLVCPATGSPATSQTPLAKYNGHGITGDSRLAAIGSHHIVISNNKVHDNCAAGIGFLKCDYITIEGNTVYNNSWYTIYGTSGISFNQCFNYDNNNSTYRIIVRNNISYGNRMYVPFYNDCKVTDGNGIILDIPLIEYTGRSLVANNICFNNGGSGIHSFKMNHVDIVHNISYLNSASPEINSSNIYALQSDDIKIYNNIIVARPGKKINGVNSSTNLLYDYNIFYGGASYELVGAHSFIRDPKFVNPSTDPLVADFHLQPGSLGINTGDNANSYGFDYAGNPRPLAGTVDIGVYETSFSGSALCTGNTASLVLSNGNGNGTGEASASLFYAMADTKPSVSNQKSRKAILYPSTLLTSIPANTSITSLKFRRAIQISSTITTPSTQTIPGNSGFRIYLRNEAADNFGSAALDWNTIVPEATNPATLVYGGDAATIIGNAGGWKEIVFQSAFTYTGGNLAVFVEYIQNGNIAGGTDINWIYDNGGTQPLYNITNYPAMVNGFKSTSASGSTVVGSTLSTSNERRPVVTIGYCANGVLPVTLLNFTAQLQNNEVVINWAVAAEINNAGFEVQRSVNGTYFETIGRLGSIAPNGSSANTHNYQYTDDKPFSGRSYYRLIQKDIDGRITYSRVMTINRLGRQLNSLQIYPNPVNDKVNALVNSAFTNQLATVQIQDMSGRAIRVKQQKIIQGYNSIQLEVSTISRGTYLFIVQLNGSPKMISKFIKN